MVSSVASSNLPIVPSRPFRKKFGSWSSYDMFIQVAKKIHNLYIGTAHLITRLFLLLLCDDETRRDSMYFNHPIAHHNDRFFLFSFLFICWTILYMCKCTDVHIHKWNPDGTHFKRFVKIYVNKTLSAGIKWWWRRVLFQNQNMYWFSFYLCGVLIV